MKNRLLTTGLAAAGLLTAAAACSSPNPNVTIQDERGNYVTTSDFRKMERTDFLLAMRQGLTDFDEQLAKLRQRANDLGGDALEEFADCNEELMAQREAFLNEIARTDAALQDDWPDRREDTLEAYYELREDLDEAYEEVLEEA